MTEDEAKTKVCCGPSHAGHIPKGDTRIRCIGSECMGWRWGPKPQDVAYTVNDLPPPGPEWREDGAAVYGFQRWQRPELPPTGYCGLAGPPSI